ncbi:protein-glutamate O-methyltransferase CheR [Brevundimonas sp.]|jgi:chemotaxis protein methyltransferase CheR|uniref:CheR family methyltransferase n=1 Tax=Brevundimonas sp. TaxID=1871086 RepID=UPI002E1438BE|nr:protein-glutamate O-methyltransferase CheR [Brevundimonas sp.]
MTPEDFERLQALVVGRTGQRLGRDRMKLAQHRLASVARREGFDDVGALLAGLWDKPVASVGWAVIEALLDSETWFRRDRAAFAVFADQLLPALASARPGGRVRLWSAGCSTGQEAWSLAMAAAERGIDAQVLATDLNRLSLERARIGAYSGFEIQRGLSARAMIRWFVQADELWTAADALRAGVEFRRANLLDPMPDDQKFDVVFCRHVLGGMEPRRRALALDNIERALTDDGCLFTGPDESLDGDTVAFRPVSGRPGLYVKSAGALRRAA